MFKLHTENQPHTDTEFKILNENLRSRNSDFKSKCKRSKSVNELTTNNGSTELNIPLEEFQNKENEIPKDARPRTGTLPSSGLWDKRKGVIMGTKAFSSSGQRVCRSLEAVNAWISDDVEKVSSSPSRLSTVSSAGPINDAYVISKCNRS